MTAVPEDNGIDARDFNSHPHEEDDEQNPIHSVLPDYFNSHPHEEDDDSVDGNQHDSVISTHILTRRMTRFNVTFASPPVYFNSHPHEEDDRVCSSCDRPPVHFNSHPHEEDDID